MTDLPTQADLETFRADLKAHDGPTLSHYLELELADGEYVELEDWPARREQDEQDDWLDYVWELIPEAIQTQLQRSLQLDAEMAAADYYTMRAEQGWRDA